MKPFRNWTLSVGGLLLRLSTINYQQLLLPMPPIPFRIPATVRSFVQRCVRSAPPSSSFQGENALLLWHALSLLQPRDCAVEPFVSREWRSSWAACVTLSIARLKAGSLVLEGLVKPLNFLTNCNEDARISSSVAGGSKLCRVLIFRHIRYCAPRFLSFKFVI
jgi:hypothetical protein